MWVAEGLRRSCVHQAFRDDLRDVFFDDVCKGGLTIAEVAEALETGTYSFHLLQEYLSLLSCEIEP